MANVSDLSINRTLYARLFKKIRVSQTRSYHGVPCWEWTAFVNRVTGYAQFGVAKVGMFVAHRLFYELFVNKVPAHLVCDHLCRNTICVNPVHIEPVTSKENTARGIWTKKSGTAFKTHCKNGHSMSGENVAIHADTKARRDGSRGGMAGIRRACKQCARDKEARRRQRLLV